MLAETRRLTPLLQQSLLFPPEVEIEAGAGNNEKGGRLGGEHLHLQSVIERAERGAGGLGVVRRRDRKRGKGLGAGGRTPTAALFLNASGLWVEYRLGERGMRRGMDPRGSRCTAAHRSESERRRTVFIRKVTCPFGSHSIMTRSISFLLHTALEPPSTRSPVSRIRV